jgi:hypothetical protein
LAVSLGGDAGFSLDGDAGFGLSGVAMLALSRVAKTTLSHAVEVALCGVGSALVRAVEVGTRDAAGLGPICILRLAICDVAKFVMDCW